MVEIFISGGRRILGLATTLSMFLALIFFFHSLPAVSAVEGEKKDEISAIYTLGPGDKLRVTVFNHADLSNEYQVDDTGSIAMPLIGSFRVTGLSIREFEKAVTLKLKDGYLVNPSVTAEVVKFRPFYILGEVTRPGSYSYINGMTVLNAVALAGGFTSRAKKSGIYIRRGDDTKTEIRVTLESKILPGDIIEVPERYF